MTLRYQLPVLIAVSIAAPLSASPDPPQSNETTILGDIQMKAICGPEDKYTPLSRLPVPGSTPRFILHAGGDLELGSSKSSDGVFSFDDFKGEAIARITGTVGVAPKIWCSRVTAGAVYQIPGSVAEGTMLRVQLYVVQSDPTPQLAAERQALLSAAQLAERQAVHLVHDLQELVDRLATMLIGEPVPDDILALGRRIEEHLQN